MFNKILKSTGSTQDSGKHASQEQGAACSLQARQECTAIVPKANGPIRHQDAPAARLDDCTEATAVGKPVTAGMKLPASANDRCIDFHDIRVPAKGMAIPLATDFIRIRADGAQTAVEGNVAAVQEVDDRIGGVPILVDESGQPVQNEGLRTGGWIHAVKYVSGVMTFAVAIHLISPITPAWLSMLLWALLLIGSAIFLHALDPLPSYASGWVRLWKALGVVLLILGFAMIFGMLAGSRNLLQPLDIFKGGGIATGSLVTESSVG